VNPALTAGSFLGGFTDLFVMALVDHFGSDHWEPEPNFGSIEDAHEVLRTASGGFIACVREFLGLAYFVRATL
jgi:hypothetical protein